MDGILNLNKPRGLTSHDVVARVRAVARQREVGHAGTLDPMATGVLLLCLGRATRLAEYLMHSPKLYRARIRLGITTDTDDAEGTIIAERPVQADRAAVEAALEQFRGRILQVPPVYSALKRGGQPLYRLARQGRMVERPPRPVEIYRLDLTLWEPPELTLEVLCSPGTYIRALARDLGEALGCGAHLTGLIRLASGDFRLEDAVELETVTPETLPALLLPPDTALARYPALYLDEARARAIRHGGDIAIPSSVAPEELQTPAIARAYGPDGRLLAVMEYRPDRGTWHPRKVLL
ncbi:MAG: tRNA pseudouridine(55) synthase TruB [Anaerolineae bacterium]|nr:tRNA pseudouridine(55) synthase TruB [Anaerolineae bacterium]MDW8069472.1 tRNA pseudouridine(55) synthase TruB [Anaerolineae bacterium]